MRAVDWYVEVDDGAYEFRAALLESLRQGPHPETTDLDAALTLLDAIGNWVEAWDEGEPDDVGRTSEALRTLQTICARLGIEADLTSQLKAEPRRRHLAVWTMLEPVHEALVAHERNLLARGLDEHPDRIVAREIDSLRALWRAASDPASLSAVGNQAVRVLETLSDLVGDPAIPQHQTKNRIMRYLDSRANGHANAELKAVAKDAVDLAHATKHDRNPSRQKAGSAANAAILVASLVHIAGEN